jgi:hypothetical protein
VTRIRFITLITYLKALFTNWNNLNYFTKFANDYNPVIGEFFIQDKKEIGNYPNLDFLSMHSKN